MITKVSARDYQRLITIWENSVRATHNFITEEDIQHYKPLILEEYFYRVDLFCYKDENFKIYGFMGVVADKLEMLFIDNCERGKGIGKQLLLFAVNKKNVEKVDVNEQNTQAVDFYKHMGFKVVGRSDVDATGKEYPILFMEFKK
ncbi:MAG: yjaB [Bacillus sp. (in: firmicutes)]|nr:yjaB [Bacillus sp. (in: firmicutes)]